MADRKGNGYPPKQLLDLLSRNSDVLVQINESLRALASGQMLSPQQLQQFGVVSPTPTPSEVPYDDISIKLDTTTTDYELPGVFGDFLDAWTDGDLTGIAVKFNSLANKPLYLSRRHTIYGFKFNKLYLTWTAQAGKTLDLFIGREASAYVDSPVISNISTLLQLTPIAKASQHGVAETLNTDILATDLSPTNTPCLFRINVMLDTSGVFSAMLKNGGATKTLKLNGGNALNASAAYLFDILVHSGDTVNFQTSASGNVTLRVQEIVAASQ